jgi:hypothetical protein
MTEDEIRRYIELGAAFIREADEYLAQSGALDCIRRHGEAHFHGSYKLRTMAWRELDIFIGFRAFTMDNVYAFFNDIVRTVKPAEMFVLDQIQHERRRGPGNCFKFELTTRPYTKPDGGWKLDLCCIDEAAWPDNRAHSDRTLAALDDHKRAKIVKIKSALWATELYRSAAWRPHDPPKSYGGVDIYEAVDECGVEDPQEFLHWIDHRQQRWEEKQRQKQSNK